jgi:hypothetical protein
MNKSYIPHRFKHMDLIRWKGNFRCHNDISMEIVISLFAKICGEHRSGGGTCVGFVSESGPEILCCKLNDRDSGDAWVSVRGISALDEANEITSFCNWLKSKGCLKRT